MPLLPSNLARHELIGLEVEILESRDPGLRGLRGRVVDETKNMLKIRVGGKVKSVPKSIVYLRFILPEGEEVRLEGKELVARPEERVRRA
ncbi:MAG: ribonuclease P protein component 1 [Hadesarchaea archaeon]|jgi:ribonuclease P protein subunit POP4|nr:ribonuclease P protein component 1 [Hadesarchaea archaeon]TDA31668.1 MAG: ribonuclease P protein subunit [Hadesarchaea archaeon]